MQVIDFVRVSDFTNTYLTFIHSKERKFIAQTNSKPKKKYCHECSSTCWNLKTCQLYDACLLLEYFTVRFDGRRF